MISPIVRSLALVFVLAMACGSPTAPADGGGADASRDSGPEAPCGRDLDCGESMFCTRPRCMPGAPDTDARGCIDLGSPCPAGQACDEAADLCGAPIWCTEGRDGCRAAGNCDGDGERALECGGGDCDDDDGARYHDNFEVCDASHDEDCDPTTFGDLDADGDGFVSSTCCNGDACGEDCDDSRREVSPGATEACNAVDDDCNGSVDDEGTIPLCPGGTCGGGRCDLRAWDRVWGAATDTGSGDTAMDVAMDELGNVYVTGTIYGSSDFGGGPVTIAARQTMYVAAFTADGVLRWVRTYGGPSARITGDSITFDVTTHTVYAAANLQGTATFGTPEITSGLRSAILIALTADGEELWALELPENTGAEGQLQIDAANGTVVVIGYMISGWDFGGGLESPSENDVFVVAYSATAVHRWTTRFAARWNTTLDLVDVDVAADGSVVLGGSLRGLGSVDVDGDRLTRGGFVVRLDASGTHLWHRIAATIGTADLGAMAVGREEIYLSGSATTADLGGGPGPADARGFLLALDLEGNYRWDRRFHGAASVRPCAADVDSGGNIIVAGFADGSADVGSGPRTVPAGADSMSFVTSFRSDNTHRWDVVFGDSGETSILGLAVGRADSTAICGAFSGSADFGSGPRGAVGTASAFVARLAN